jgi:hypothetical protein
MPNLKVAVPYDLSPDEALQRIKSAIAKAQRSGKVSDLEESWNGYVGTIRGSAVGQSASGTVTVNPSEIIFAIALPFAASLFKARIEAGIREFTAELFAK